MVGICQSLDGRFKKLAKLFADRAIVVNEKKSNIDELIIPGINQAGYVLGSSFYLPNFLALNPTITVYTLMNNEKLKLLQKKYQFSLVSLLDNIYINKEIELKLHIVHKMLLEQKLDKHNVYVYGNDIFADKYCLKKIVDLNKAQIIINFDLNLYQKANDLKKKIIFDLTNERHGFLNLLLKEKDISFYAINQYLGVYLIANGAKLIYESWERNRVSH